MFRKLKEEISNINDIVSNIQDKVAYMVREFRNIEELYTNFKIFVDGFCNQDIDMDERISE